MTAARIKNGHVEVTNSRSCKHMFLLKRHSNIPIETISRIENLLAQTEASSASKQRTINPLPDDNTILNTGEIPTLTRDIKHDLDSFRHLKRSIIFIAEYDVLKDIQEE